VGADHVVLVRRRSVALVLAEQTMAGAPPADGERLARTSASALAMIGPRSNGRRSSALAPAS